MQVNKRNKLLQILSQADQSVSSKVLANLMNVSERTVRNYIKEINSEGQNIIQSSKDGYRIQSTSFDNFKDNKIVPSETENRIYHVLSDLLTNKDGINAFDEADSLFVSSSTIINTIIPQIKKLIRDYDLHIESQKYQFVLIGSEQNKRKLIGHIATNGSYGFFNSKEALNQLFPQYDISEIMQRLYQACQQSSLFLNDYALNNLLIHILVLLIRLESDNSLDIGSHSVSINDLMKGFPDKDDILSLASQISAVFQEEYGIHIPESDYHQLLILIALSVEHGSTLDIQNFISQEFINNILSILSAVSIRYCTIEFTDEFAMQFALHMYYARQRYLFRISYPNPIGAQFKKDYAPIFDMAVYFAHKFDLIYHTELSEDEIAFIAFHIGSYLETSNQGKEYVSCVIIAESYHFFAKKLVRDLEENFPHQLIVTDLLPLNRYLEKKPVCDLVITTIPLTSNCHAKRVLLVNPVLTRQNISTVRSLLNEISSEKELSSVRAFLQSLLHRELYFRNISLDTTTDYIQFMGQQCLEYGYVNDNFIQDVILRESASCTAFTDTLAVPHSIGQFADKSFICVIHNDLPISWNQKTVYFIFMIGIAEQDMKYFRAAFDLIIDLFNSPERTFDIMKTSSFDEFYSKMK